MNTQIGFKWVLARYISSIDIMMDMVRRLIKSTFVFILFAMLQLATVPSLSQTTGDRFVSTYISAHNKMTNSSAWKKLAWTFGLDSIDSGSETIFEAIVDYAYELDEEFQWGEVGEGLGRMGYGVASFVPVTKVLSTSVKGVQLLRVKRALDGMGRRKRLRQVDRYRLVEMLEEIGENKLARGLRRSGRLDSVRSAIRQQLISYSRRIALWGGVRVLNEVTKWGVPARFAGTSLAFYAAAQGCLVLANDPKYMTSRIGIDLKERVLLEGEHAYQSIVETVEDIRAQRERKNLDKTEAIVSCESFGISQASIVEINSCATTGESEIGFFDNLRVVDLPNSSGVVILNSF